MNESFEKITADFHDHLTHDANARLNCGIAQRLGELPDPGLAAAAERLKVATNLLARYQSVNTTDLDFDTQLDIELASLMLTAEIHEGEYQFNGLTQLQQLPCAGSDIGDGIFLLFINDPRPDAERLVDVVGRLEAVPAYLKGMLGRLTTPVARWVAMDLEAVAELPDLFETIEGWANSCQWPAIKRLQDARVGAEMALNEYATQLQAMPTTTQLHIGVADAQKIVALQGIELSLEQLHQMAADFLAKTRHTVEELRSRLVHKYGLDEATSAEDLQQFLAQRFRIEIPSGELDDVLKHYENARDDLSAFIEERALFPMFEQQSMKIIRTPPFMEPSIPAGAMLPPPAFREGERTSMVYLTLSEELLDEHTALSIPSMMVHEGIPGHHLQLATASLHHSTVRRHVSANDHAEGWTTMLEDYMLDVGYMAELADEVRFCGKRDLSRIGARVGIDLFFMTGDKKYLDVGVQCDVSSDDPFVAAGNLLAAVTGFVPGRVQAELNWYSQERGYPLSYLTGNTLVWKMKEELAASQAGVLEGLHLDRRFHDVYLKSGNMPLSFLRRVLVHKGLLPAA